MKRVATRQLTAENWDEDDPEHEEPANKSVFASEDVLARRKILVARRRVTVASDAETPNPFMGWKGFTSSTPKTAPFTLQHDETSKGAVSEKKNSTSTTDKTTAVGGTQSTVSSQQITPSVTVTMNRPTDPTEKVDERSAILLERIKKLNQDFLAHIAKSFNQNHHVNFEPSFADYTSHLKSLLRQYGIKNEDEFWSKGYGAIEKTSKTGEVVEKRTEEEVASSPIVADKEKCSEESQSTKDISPTRNSETIARNLFPVIAQPQSEMKRVKIGTQEAVSADSEEQPKEAPKSLFPEPPASFSGNKLFNFSGTSFAATTTPSFGSSLFDFKMPATTTTEESNEEIYVPPIVEKNTFTEEGSVYDVRCKVFYRDPENKNFKDIGIGQLFVKPLQNSRVQMIVRADNSIGNVLLNIAVDKKTPFSKAGSNGISVVAVPDPPILKGDNATIPLVLLLRVKGNVQQEELWQKISEAKT